jgi:hypothetical protein
LPSTVATQIINPFHVGAARPVHRDRARCIPAKDEKDLADNGPDGPPNHPQRHPSGAY